MKKLSEEETAIYAEYFEMPFLKSNDSAFREGQMGRVAFPDLMVKDLSDMLKDLVVDRIKRQECFQLIKDNRAIMNEGKRSYEAERGAPATEEQIQLLLNKWRN